MRLNNMAVSENVLSKTDEGSTLVDEPNSMSHGSSGSLIGGLDPFQSKSQNWGSSTYSSTQNVRQGSRPSIPFGLSALSIQSDDDYGFNKSSHFTRPSLVPPPSYPAPNVSRREMAGNGEVRAMTRRETGYKDVELGSSPVCGESPPPDSRRSSKDICITIDFASEDELGLPTGTKLSRSFVKPDIRRYSTSTQSINPPDIYQCGLDKSITRQFGLINRPLSIKRENQLGYQSRELSVSNSNVSGIDSSDTSEVDYDNHKHVPLELGNMLSSNLNLRDLSLRESSRGSGNSGRLELKSSGDTIKRVRRNNQEIVRNSPQPYQAKMKKLGLAKCNSCSTLFVDYTLIMADLSETVSWYIFRIMNSAAKSILSIIRANKAAGNTFTVQILSEELHPLSNHVQFYKKIPTLDEIVQFIGTLYNAAELTVECVIIALIYIERFLEKTGVALQAANWSRIFVCSTLLAAKVWDDHAVWNVDFQAIFQDVDIEDLYEINHV
jgi:hypothetical protein